MLDNKTLETRLILKESALVGSSVSKCASRFQTLISSKKIGNTSDDQIIEGFIREMCQYELEISKAENLHDSYQKQLSSYAEIEKEIQKQIKDTELNILSLEQTLRNEKLIRLHREHCEAQAQRVDKLPSKQSLKRKIDSVEANLKSTEDSINTLNHKLLQRHKQFSALLQCITDLQSNLEEETDTMVVDTTTVVGMNKSEDENDDVDRDEDEEDIDDLPSATDKTNDEDEEIEEGSSAVIGEETEINEHDNSGEDVLDDDIIGDDVETNNQADNDQIESRSNIEGADELQQQLQQQQHNQDQPILEEEEDDNDNDDENVLEGDMNQQEGHSVDDSIMDESHDS